MIEKVQQITESLPERVGSGIFGLSFLSWQGNFISFKDSLWMVYLIYFLLIVCILSIYILKNQIRVNYLNNQKTLINVFRFIGVFIISMVIFRIIILSVGGYPNLWELIPFHFCRMFIILIAFSLILKKLNYIKYFGVFAIGGGIIGLLISDLSNTEYWTKYGGAEIGIDNYIFWDFFIIHFSSVIMPIYLFTCLKPVIYKSTIVYSILAMFWVTIMIFVLNIAFSNLTDPRWRPNWFYVGVPSLNGIDDLLRPYIGIFAGYPIILATFIVIGVIMYLSFIAIYLNSDRLDFFSKDEITNKWKLKINIVPSINIENFVEGPLKYREYYNL